MMLTERGIGLAGAAGALWLTSRGFGVPELQIAAVAAIGTLVLAVVVTRLSSARLEVDRSCRPGRLFHDAEARVALVVHNRSRLPTAALELEDRAPSALASRGARMRLGSLPPLASRTMAYQLRGHRRGRFEVGPLTARLRDPFGLVTRRVELPGTSRLLVYPRIWTLSDEVPLGGAASSGRGRTRPLSSGDDLAHVREYVRGDDLRKVHWPTTAHRGTLMVRQPEAPRDPRATVLLDARAQVHRGHGSASSLETAISAAASVIHHLALHGRAVTLLDGPVTSPPGPQPWRSQLARLAELEATRSDLRPALQHLAAGSLGDGLLVAVLTVPGPDDLRELVRAGRAFTTRLALVVDAQGHATGTPPTEAAHAPVDALRVAGWRTSLLGAHDRIDERWRDLLLHKRRVPAAGGRR
jgi:uncharacterized protein (DUF58 family)